jgi:hypothetical protein
MANNNALRQFWLRGKNGRDDRFIAMHDELYSGMPFGSAHQSGRDHAGAGITAHGINRNGQITGHATSLPQTG